MRLSIVICLLCVAAMLPPTPRRPKVPLFSPKDAASRTVRYAITVPVTFTNSRLVWDNIYTQDVGFVVQQRTNLVNDPWRELGRVTNLFVFHVDITNDQCFYRVGSFWP